MIRHSAGSSNPAMAVRDPEPNDAREQAVPLTPGERTIGYVDAPADPAVGDQDWYVVQVPRGAPLQLRAELSGAEDLDVVLEWMPRKDTGRSQARIQADVHEKKPGPELLEAIGVEPGPVFLRVREAWYRGKPRVGSRLPYVLHVTLTPRSPGHDVEPNGSPHQAIEGTWGRRVTGTLGHIRDKDSWRFRVPTTLHEPAHRVRFTTPAGVRSKATLTFPDETSASSEGDGGAELLFRHLDLTPFAGQALTISVKATEGAAPGVPYGLVIEPESFTSPDQVEREPNDTEDRATPLTAGEGAQGHLDRPGDQDHFRFEGGDQASASLTLSAPPGVDVVLTATHPELEAPIVVDDQGTGTHEALRGLALRPGPWLISVTAKRGSYHTTAPYRVTVASHAGESVEQEPNDGLEDEGVLALAFGQVARGWIHPASDVDRWWIDVPEGDGAILTFDLAGPEGVPMDVRLLDPAGAEAVHRAADGARNRTTFTHFLNPGRHALVISARDDSDASADSGYELRIVP